MPHGKMNNQEGNSTVAQAYEQLLKREQLKYSAMIEAKKKSLETFHEFELSQLRKSTTYTAANSEDKIKMEQALNETVVSMRKAAQAEIQQLEFESAQNAYKEAIRVSKLKSATLTTMERAAHEAAIAQFTATHEERVKIEQAESVARADSLKAKIAATRTNTELSAKERYAKIQDLNEQLSAEEAHISEIEGLRKEATKARIQAEKDAAKAEDDSFKLKVRAASSAAEKQKLIEDRLHKNQEKLQEARQKAAEKALDKHDEKLAELEKAIEEAEANGDTELVKKLTVEYEEEASKDDETIKQAAWAQADKSTTDDQGQNLAEVVSALEQQAKVASDAAKQEKFEQEKKRVSEINTSDRAAEILQEREIKELEDAKEAEAQREADLAELKNNPEKKLSEVLQKGLDNLTDKMTQLIDGNINSYYQYAAEIDGRLQGSNKDYHDIMTKSMTKIMFLGVINQKDMLESLKRLSDEGVAYNIELRAFLGTISESIASTFDAFDANLLRLIRLQQADTTAARLGMEASLTKLFNHYFSDTNYLKQVADSVSSAILDASSQLTRDASAEFEFITQKWLGALYSLGLSQETVSSIAQGLNYLGTGDVEALNSNDTVRTLFAMAAAQGGLSFADILTGGLDAKITNDLLKSMVEYLRSIANNTDHNQVTKAAYTDVFGLSMSDLTAISNLTDSDIKNIHSEQLSYSAMMSEVDKQLGKTVLRVPLPIQLDNLMDNLMMSAAVGIGDDLVSYGLWKATSLIGTILGSADNIPFINIFGSGLDLNTSVTSLIRLGLTGLGMLDTLLTGLFNGAGFGSALTVGGWDFDEFTSRGGSLKGISSGTASGTSLSQQLSNNVVNTNSEDMKKTALSDAADAADEDKEIVNKNVQGEQQIFMMMYEDLHDLHEWANPAGSEPGLKVMGVGGGGGGGNDDTSSDDSTTNQTPPVEQPEEGTDPTQTPNQQPSSGSPEKEPEESPSTSGSSNPPNGNSSNEPFMATQLIVESLTAGYLMLQSSNTSLEEILNKDSDVTTTLDAFYNKWQSSIESIKQESNKSSETFFDAFYNKWQSIEHDQQESDTTSETFLDKFFGLISSSEQEKLVEDYVSHTNSLIGSFQQSYLETNSTMIQGISSVLSSIATWEKFAIKSENDKEEDKKIAIPTSLKTSLTSIDPAVKSELQKMLREAVFAAWREQFVNSEGDEEQSFVNILKELFDNLEVRVTNNFFDEMLQRNAFNN